MRRLQLQQTIMGALGIALVFVSTYIIKIPNGLQGYIHFGDGMLLAFASFTNPWISFAIGGIGSAMADVVGGYGLYMLPTFFIKGLEAMLVSLLIRHMKHDHYRLFIYMLGCIIMLTGYFITDSIINDSWQLGAIGIVSNLIQASAGVLIAYLAFPIMKKAYLHRTGTSER